MQRAPRHSRCACAPEPAPDRAPERRDLLGPASGPSALLMLTRRVEGTRAGLEPIGPARELSAAAPMSSTERPSPSSKCASALRKPRRASRRHLTRILRPASSRARARNAAPFVASRTALVATASSRDAPIMAGEVSIRSSASNARSMRGVELVVRASPARGVAPRFITSPTRIVPSCETSATMAASEPMSIAATRRTPSPRGRPTPAGRPRDRGCRHVASAARGRLRLAELEPQWPPFWLVERKRRINSPMSSREFDRVVTRSSSPLPDRRFAVESEYGSANRARRPRRRDGATPSGGPGSENNPYSRCRTR